MTPSRMTFIALALAAAQALAAQEPMTLREALAAARDQPAVARAEAELAAARAVEAEVRSSFLPKLGFEAGYERVEPQRGQELDFEPYLPIDVKSAASAENSLEAGVDLSFVVYDGGRRSLESELAGLGVEAAGVRLSGTSRELGFAVARCFYAALFFAEETKVLDGEVAALGQHLEEARAREETGSATRYDVLSTQERASKVEGQAIEAKKDLAVAKVALGRLTGRKGDFSASGTLAPLGEEPDGGAALLGGLSSREDLRLSALAQEEAQLKEGLAGAANYPSLESRLRSGYRNGVLTFDNSDVDRLVFCWSAGLSLRFPLFDGFLARGKRAEALALVEADRASAEDARRAAEAEARQALLELDSARRQAGTTLARLDRAEEELELAQAQYSLGAFTNLQYLDARTSLEEARLEKLRALYRELLCGLALRRALGKEVLDPDPR